jgi:uncharacterized alkaline shock family protein YloU
MASAEGATSSASTARTASAPSPDTAGNGDGLHTERGNTRISDNVVTKVAGIAAREVPGVHDLGGGAARAIGGLSQKVGVGDQRSQGVTVEVGERQAAVDLTVVMEYGESIPQVTEHVRENVVRRIEGITGLSVTEVNIAVNDLYFPGDDAESEESARVG